MVQVLLYIERKATARKLVVFAFNPPTSDSVKLNLDTFMLQRSILGYLN